MVFYFVHRAFKFLAKDLGIYNIGLIDDSRVFNSTFHDQQSRLDS